MEDESILNGWKKDYKFLGITFKKSWLNSGVSWKNKWKLDADGNLIEYTAKDWWYFGVYPKYQERYTYSSTLFVWMTDAEHLFQQRRDLYERLMETTHGDETKEDDARRPC